MKKIFAVLAALVILTSMACGGGGSGSGSDGTGEVPNQVDSTSVSIDTETIITVSDAKSPIVGTKVIIPKEAAKDNITVVLGYEDNPPAPFSTSALAMGTTQASKVIIPHVINGGPSTFNHLIEITIPYDKTIAGDLPPVVVYWDEIHNTYRPVSVVKIDRVNGLVTFNTSHFSKYMAVIVKILAVSMPDVDTGFQIGVDSILHINFGSYEYRGHCAAFASISTYYYSLKKATKLYAFAQDGIREDQLDDELVRSALRDTHCRMSTLWNDVVKQTNVPNKIDTGYLALSAMIATGLPVHFTMTSDGIHGHSVVVYGYDSANARFRIYDSYFPKEEVTFGWNQLTGFGSYSNKNGYVFDKIGYLSDATLGAPNQFDEIIDNWKNGKIEDYFANLSVTDQDIVQKLEFGSNVERGVAHLNPVSLTGNFSSPATNNNEKNYLHVYQNHVKRSVYLIPSSGDFSFDVNGKISTDNDIELLVSGLENDLFAGFVAYGKFTISPMPGHNISGRITFNGAGLAGVTVTLTGTGSSSVVTDATGAFTFTNAANGSYTLSFSASNYTFNPSSLSIDVNDGNFTVETDIVATVQSSGGTWTGTKQLYTTYSALYATGVAVDASGNVYVTGYTNGNMDGNTNAGGYDMFLVKYNSAGTKEWTRQLGTALDDEATGVAVDASGNVYVTGYTEGGLDGNTNAWTGYGYLFDDMFLVKYNSAGTKQWTRQLGSTADDRAQGVAVDTSGNVYVTGYTERYLDGNTDAGGDDMFLVKFNSAGTKQWTRLLGSDDRETYNYDEARGVAVDASGNVYVTGYTNGDMDGNTNANLGIIDMFLVKYNSAGTKQWTRQLGVAHDDRGQGIAVDTRGNIYVTGWTGGGLDGITNAGSYDMFLVSYNASGIKQWTREWGTAQYDDATDVAVDTSGNIYVTVETEGRPEEDPNPYAWTMYGCLVKYDTNGIKQ